MAISIAFEGPEGVGKTAQVRVVGDILDKILHRPVLLVREPGGTELSEAVRNILKNEEWKDMHPRTGVLLYSAARNELLFKKAIPWMEENPSGFAIADRCQWSTRALQSVDGADEKYIRVMQEPFDAVWPDKVIYTDIHPQESKIRVERSRHMKEHGRWWRDYVGIAAYEMIRGKYLELVKEYRDKTLLLDGFMDPALRAHQAVTFILGSEPFEFNSETRANLMGIWENVTGLSYEAMLHVEGELRNRLGFADKKVLHQAMLSDWKRFGLERTGLSVERK